ncbi:MAG: hypothetical protein Q4C71_02600 [Microbacteriaceae bacterium]|nr:hypothetical protein [Microbacteriaceae bacterium]
MAITDPTLSALVNIVARTGVDVSEYPYLHEQIGDDFILELTLNGLIKHNTPISEELFVKAKEQAEATQDPDIIGCLDRLRVSD